MALDPAHRSGPGAGDRELVASPGRALKLGVDADVNSNEQDGVPLVAAELVKVVPASKVTQSGPSIGPSGGSALDSRLTLAPLERLAVSHALSGATGENCSTAFCYIQANHDPDAVRADLNRYRDQPKTLRAYPPPARCAARTRSAVKSLAV